MQGSPTRAKLNLCDLIGARIGYSLNQVARDNESYAVLQFDHETILLAIVRNGFRLWFNGSKDPAATYGFSVLPLNFRGVNEEFPQLHLTHESSPIPHLANPH